MNTNLMIGIGIAVVMYALYYFLAIVPQRKKNREQLENFKKNHSDAPLTEAQKRMLVFGAILSYHRSEDILDITPNTGIDTYVNGLRNQWNVDDRYTAQETLNRLLAMDRSTEIDSYLNEPNSDIDKVRKKISKILKEDEMKVDAVRSSYAWDICRLVSMAKWCYWCGYVNESEMWDFIKQGADKAAAKGTDWQEYTIAFMLGRTISGFDIDDVSAECYMLYNSKGPSMGKKRDEDVYLRYSFKA